jgi:hypothetical protein
VLEYCKHAAAAAAANSAAAGTSTNKEDLASFDRAFIDGFDAVRLLDLVHASTDLEVLGAA